MSKQHNRQTEVLQDIVSDDSMPSLVNDPPEPEQDAVRVDDQVMKDYLLPPDNEDNGQVKDKDAKGDEEFEDKTDEEHLRGEDPGDEMSTTVHISGCATRLPVGSLPELLSIGDERVCHSKCTRHIK